MIELVTYRPQLDPALLALWRSASLAAHPIMPDLWEAHTRADPSFQPADVLVAALDGDPVGFAVTKRFREAAPTCERYRDVGYLSLLAVAPDRQRQGIGTRLVRAAEDLLRAGGARRVVVGGSFHHVMPGLPTDVPGLDACVERWGYRLGSLQWDVRRDLAQPPAPPNVELDPAYTLRPFAIGEEAAFVAFMGRAFPGRWARDTRHHLAHGGAIAEVMGLFHHGEPAGFAQLHPPGGVGALRWSGFNARMAALGPIGVEEAHRGGRRGLALLVAGLEELRRRGATDTVIDWTDLLDFYGKAGFQPWRSYRLADRELG